MKITLVEFSWHAKKIVNDKKSLEEGNVLVSLDPESSYILKTNKIPYFESYQFCNHQELWGKYGDITKRTINISNELDKALWNTDNRFRELDWKFFGDHYYSLKVSFDQLFYYSELISKLIEKFDPSEIIIADSKKMLINNKFRIDSNISVIKHLLKTIEYTLVNTKITFLLPEKKNTIFLFLGKLKKFSLYFVKDVIKNKIGNFYYKINFLINYYNSKPKYLSIGCHEILKYKKLYPSESKFFLNYQHGNIIKKKFSNDPNFHFKFMNYLKNKSNYYDLIKNKNISFKFIFNEILYKLTEELDFMIEEYKKAKKIVKKIKPECIIFQSMTPVHSANITFKKVCLDYKIPFVTWAHGGYGLTNSLGTYDGTDFRFCKNHISYGSYLKDLVQSDKCILKQLNLQNNQKILPVGSMRLDYDNKQQVSKGSFQNNKKKTILYIMGGPGRTKNQFYFGFNRKKSETSYWEFHYGILRLLKKYQNKYNIIFKDYPNGKKNLWKSILKDIGADKISYMSDELSVNHLLRISDLNIMPWITTTFFEALYFDADIFVIEDDIFEEPFQKKIKGEIFYFKDENRLKFNLEKYLEEGKFYTCSKKLSKKYLLNLDYFNKRDILLKEALNSISKH